MSADQPLSVPLAEWVAASKARLDAFASMWARESAAQPESYPDRMTSGDWDAQFYSFDMLDK